MPKIWLVCIFYQKRFEPFVSSYKTPDYFKSDWLNEYCLGEAKSDYRFVYLGPKNSKTPIHRDVLASHSWSANVTGKKLWHFWAPDKGEMIREHIGEYVEDGEILENTTFTVVQETGETIFVPSGWYHQVANLQETVSINHNWINSGRVINILIEYRSFMASRIKKLFCGVLVKCPGRPVPNPVVHIYPVYVEASFRSF